MKVWLFCYENPRETSWSVSDHRNRERPLRSGLARRGIVRRALPVWYGRSIADLSRDIDAKPVVRSYGRTFAPRHKHLD
jgi:hypothetical protein